MSLETNKPVQVKAVTSQCMGIARDADRAVADLTCHMCCVSDWGFITQ